MRIAFNFNKKVNKEQSWREHRCKHERSKWSSFVPPRRG